MATALYLPSSGNPLVWDDELHVPNAAETRLSDAFGRERGDYRRPLVLLSYGAQVALGGKVARNLHVANALVHGANAALVAAIAVALAGTTPVALAAALVFAFHPLGSGSVAYISGRTDLFATLFLLLAAWLVAGRRGDRRGVGWPALLACCAAVAASGLSKESGLMAGPVVAAVLWWRRAGCGDDVPVLRILLPVAVSAVVAVFVLPPAAASAVSLDLRLRGAGTALLTFGRLLVWPAGLHLDRLTPTGGGGAAMAGAVLLAAWVALLFSFVRRPRLATLAGVALVLVYAPGSGFVPVYPAIADHLVFTGEQFAYAPLAVIGLALAGGVAWLTGSRPLVPLALAVLAVLGGTLPVVMRQSEFARAEQVYRKTLTYSPSPRACFNLGNLDLARRNFDAAVTTYQSCLGLAPNDAGIHGQLAVALQKLGFAEDARQEYERSVALDPSDALVWSNYATLDANAGRYAAAREKWNKALEIDPAEETARAALKRLDAAGR